MARPCNFPVSPALVGWLAVAFVGLGTPEKAFGSTPPERALLSR